MLWLRELELSPLAAAAGGLAFEIAPYRLAQSRGHLLGPISLLLPLALWAFERARRSDDRRWWWLSRPGPRLDPALRPGAPRARGDPLLRPLRALPDARATGRSSRRRSASSPRCSPGVFIRLHGDRGVDRRGRALALRGEGLLGDRARPRHPPRAPRGRGVRLPRLADAARSRSPGSSSSLRSGRGAARGRARPRRRSSRSCSRSARTTRSTARSGTSSRRSATRACPSG